MQGWTSLEVAEAFGVTPKVVRNWRGWFSERGADALRSTLAPGPLPAKGERALAVASLLLRRLERRYGPRPGWEHLPLVWNNGPAHTSRATRAALAEGPWITVEWLPQYAPELNEIERTWCDLKRHHLAHRTLKSTADLACAIHTAVKQLNKERINPHPCDKLNKAA